MGTRKYLVIVAVLLMSCSATNLLKRSEYLKLKAISKGAKVQVDTVWKFRPVAITVPEFDAAKPVKAVVDSNEFWTFMPSYDSLLLEHEKLKGRIGTEVSAREKVLRDQLFEARKRIARGFYKDSIYTINYDSINSVTLVVKDGIVKIVKLRTKEHVVKGEQSIPIAVEDKISAGFTIWQMIGAVFAGVVLSACAIGIWLWIRLRKQEVEELRSRNV